MIALALSFMLHMSPYTVTDAVIFSLDDETYETLGGCDNDCVTN